MCYSSTVTIYAKKTNERMHGSKYVGIFFVPISMNECKKLFGRQLICGL